MKIVIIGAGVAGAILARRLHGLQGVELHCLERVGADDHSEAGTGLNVGPNALKALRRCDPELHDRVREASLPWAHWRTSLADGTVLADLPLARVADNPGIRIRWSELYRVLRQGAGAAVRYGCSIEAIGRMPDGARCFVRYAQDGHVRTIEDIDLLVGADGRYSQTRAAFSGLPEPRHVGVAILRTLVPDTSRGLVDDYGQWFNGPHRLLAFRVPPDHVYIAATYPVAPGEALRDEWKTPDALRRCYTPAAGRMSAQVRWLVDAMCGHLDGSHWARMQESELRFIEPDAQVLYLGDSAHGMAPTLGQGATQAMEDACVASELVERAIRSGLRQPRDWLRAIEAVRTPRLRFAMQLSIDASDTLLAGADPVAGTHWKTEAPFLDDLSRLYRDLHWGAEPVGA